MDSNKSWLLKILTGPHVGSEAILSPGVYLLGKDNDCDIILHDTSLMGQHFQLTLDANKISLNVLAKDYPYYIDGIKADTDSSTEINPYQVISTGTLFFTLGSTDEAWPPIELLGVGRNFKHTEEPTTQEETMQESTDDVKESDDEKSPPRPPSSIVTIWQRWWGDNSPLNRSYLSIGIALIGIGLSLLLVVLSTSKVPQLSIENEAAKINKLIETYVIDATLRTLIKDGRKVLHIYGYTKTNEQRDAFTEALGKAEITAQIQLHSAERLQHAVLVLLEQSLNPATDRVEVSAISGFPGKVMLSGYVENGDAWAQVLDMIEDDVSGLQGYDDRVHTLDEAVEALGKMLTEQNLYQKVDINVSEHIIYLSSGMLSDAEQQRLAVLSENFRTLFGTQPQLNYREQGEAPIKQFMLDIAVLSISFGTSPYLQTEDGNRYTIGAVLGDGYIIKEINRQFILLSKKGELGRYYYTAKP